MNNGFIDARNDFVYAEQDASAASVRAVERVGRGRGMVVVIVEDMGRTLLLGERLRLGTAWS